MFSVSEKKLIAAKIEEILLSLNHPEMPKTKPKFLLHVEGAESWSWADIKPNWTFGLRQPDINPWNEMARDIIPIMKKIAQCLHCGKPTDMDVSFCSDKCRDTFETTDGQEE